MMSRRARTFLIALAVSVGACALAVSSASAGDQVREYTMTPSTTQAGGHPDIETFLYVENADTGHFPPNSCECQDPRSLIFDAPPGVIADPHATPLCTQTDFANQACPIDSQVGTLLVAFDTSAPGEGYQFPVAVYNLETHPGQAGLLAFLAPIINSPIYLVVSSRTESDYGLNLTTVDITHLIGLGIAVLKMNLWGVPADPIHDPERYGPTPCDSQGTGGLRQCEPGFSSNSPMRPFIDNPTACGVPLTAFVEVISYDLEHTHGSTTYAPTTGCDQLSFNPSLFGQPTTNEADTPSGFDIDLKVPQNTSPTVPSPSEIRGATVTLPEGFSINTNAADGKEDCTDELAHFGVRNLAAECPEFSRIGSLTISSSSLPGPFSGYMYIGEPKPGDRYRLILVADGFGLHVKLPGSVEADPQTGRLTVSFQDLPQFPFSEFNMHIFGSERGILATPTACGTYSVDSTFTPWDSALPEQTSHQFFTLDSGPNGTPCPGNTRPFDPTFEAGVADKTAGVHSPFTVDVTRADGDQGLTGLDVTAPPGFTASLRGIPYCPESAIARLADGNYLGVSEMISPACPVASQIGTAVAGAGAGSRPLHVDGKVYLAGPYKGAPLSIEVVIPAVSGPYDLGNVGVRAPVRVDPVTAQVSTVSDPLPRIIGGVPLRTRFIRVTLDRPGFALNPTNCDPFAVTATIVGDQGAAASRQSHFQISNCASLPYGPKLGMKLSGGINRRGHPAIDASFTAQPGEANSRAISVTLPKGELLDNAHINNPCTRVQFAAGQCPPGSVLGTAEATTPLLDAPLKGTAYLRSSTNKLPDLAITLNGQVDLVLVGRVDSIGGRLRTTFETVPDAPVSSFQLHLEGGRTGLLQNTENLCGSHKKAMVRMTGQNEASVERKAPLQVSCGANARRSKHRRHRRHRRHSRPAQTRKAG
jgi:hypothetical protein